MHEKLYGKIRSQQAKATKMASKMAVTREGPFTRKMLLRLTEDHLKDIEKASKKAKLTKMGFVRRAIERQVAVQLSRS